VKLMEIWNVGNRIVNTYNYQIENGYIMIDTGYEGIFKNKSYNLTK